MTSRRRTVAAPDELTLFRVEVSRIGSAVSLEEHSAPTSSPTPARDRRDVANTRLLTGLTTVGHFQIPKIVGSRAVPDRLIPFSEAVSRRARPDKQGWVHFYEDDYRFIRFWSNPEKYLHQLAAYGGVVSPDYSIYRNMPRAQQIGNTYQNQLLGAWLEAAGVSVIPNVRLSGAASIPHALAGIPRGSTLAIGLNGCTKDRENRMHVIEEIRLICDFCEPAALAVYGSDKYGVLNYPLSTGVDVHMYLPDSRQRSTSRAAT